LQQHIEFPFARSSNIRDILEIGVQGRHMHSKVIDVLKKILTLAKKTKFLGYSHPGQRSSLTRSPGSSVIFRIENGY